jgi:aminoglycoside 6'-N-acetyltransferase
MEIQLRKANLNDLLLLKYWDSKPHVLFATGNDKPEEDKWLEEQLKKPSDFVWIFIAELEGRPIGVLQIVDPALEETHYWGENVSQNLRAIDIWIGEESDLSKGYGTIMMTLGINKCFENPKISSIIIDPLEKNHKAIKFYQKLGFQFIENKYFDDDYCAVHELKKINYNSFNFIMTPTEQINLQLANLTDWKYPVMTKFREMILAASQDFVEEYKWNTGVWSLNGKLVIAFGSFKTHVKFNFLKGSEIDDSKGLFNNGLESKTSRSIDLFDGENIDWDGVQDLIDQTVAIMKK